MSDYLSMDRDALYRRCAAEAQRQAERAISDDERVAWLRIADGWLALLRHRPESLEGRLDDVNEARGMDQNESGEQD